MAQNKKNAIVRKGAFLAAIGFFIIALLVGSAALGGDGDGDAALDRSIADSGGSEGIFTASRVPSSINYQGTLTDSAGNPLTGTYYITFSLYDEESGGTALDTMTYPVTVTNGLFNAYLDFDPSYFDGRALWLELRVGNDPEMTPRQELNPVPYALSLRPGAEINSSLSDAAVLTVRNTGGQSAGLYAQTYGNHSAGFIADTQGSPRGDGFYAYIQGDNSYGLYAGTYGFDSDGVHVYTEGNLSDGVDAISECAYGIKGETKSTDNAGVYGWSTTGKGVEGFTTGDNAWVPAIYGRNEGAGDGLYGWSQNRYGVYGVTQNADHKYGVYTPDYLYAKGSQYPSSDVAEFFPVNKKVLPGTVLIIGPEGILQPSATAYDTRVAGVVSTEPGVSLGTKEEGNEGETLIAVAGRVPCKVDATYGPIRPGDLLTTSDTPGYAMKATEPQIGTILGKALEPLECGTGVIEVLVTLQ